MTDIERVPSTHTVAVKCIKLRREFETLQGTHVAVNNLNLDMYDGEVLSLLGKHACYMNCF
jgi:ABC-type dipeptide/oligopeptide/nickel transport system ATPase component